MRKNLIATVSVVAVLNVAAWAGALGLPTLDAATLGMAVLMSRLKPRPTRPKAQALAKRRIVL